MRFYLRLTAVVFIALSAFASELTIRVVDPQSAAVAGAQVELFAGDSSRPLAIETTSAQGVAHFRHVSPRVLRVHVLAAGFAEAWQSIPAEKNAEEEQAAELMVSLHLAPATETVVVSATRTPTYTNESGASI